MEAGGKRKALIFDVDEVILQWRPAFLAWMARQGHRLVDGDDTCLDFSGRLPELKHDEVPAWVERFNASPDYADLKPLPWADLTIRQLVLRDFAPWRAVVVTAAGSSFSALRHRTEALSRITTCFDELHYVGIREAKADYFARYQAGSIVFEDPVLHAKDALALGHRVVFFGYPYNRDCPDDLPGLVRVENWRQARAAALNMGPWGRSRHLI
jgi:hypothetical protein